MILDILTRIGAQGRGAGSGKPGTSFFAGYGGYGRTKSVFSVPPDFKHTGLKSGG
jgi:hypothetical protein